MTKVSTFLIRQQIKKCRCELVMEGPQNYFLVVELNARSNTQGYPQKKTLIRGLASFQMAKVIILQRMKKKITIAGNHYWRINAQEFSYNRL